LNSGEYLLFGFPAILKPSYTSIVQEGLPFLFTVHFLWSSSLTCLCFRFAFYERKNGTNHESVIIYHYVVYKYHFD